MTEFEDIKGFIFDLDGVITDTAAFHTLAWRQIADEVGVQWTVQLGDALKGINRMDSLELILKHGNKETLFTGAEKISLATRKNNNYLMLVQQMTPANILPGITDFLADLQSHGYQLVLASASKNAPLVLEKLGLSSFFQKAVNPATLKHGKPNPEIFSRGAKLLNLNPAQCIGVEDAAAGIESINAANETSIGIGNPKVLADANINFDDTTQLTLDNIKFSMDH